ncbi:unnamed protein product [Rhizophagus irregularis]|nr:unnamed protein product [Rhizophagus irregularis]
MIKELYIIICTLVICLFIRILSTLANFGLLSRIKRASKRQSDSFDKVLYIDPKKLNEIYILNVGVTNQTIDQH